MPQGREKSGRFRKVHRRTPGGRTVKHLEKRLPNQQRCRTCGAILHGIPRMLTVDAKRTPKSKKTASRPYGGNLCSRCMRDAIKERL